MHPEPLFYIRREEDQLAGPYDVVQLAGLMRRKIISGDTPTKLEGTDDWKPFSWQPQFVVAREMPADAVSMRTVELDEEAAERAAGPIPLPSRETVLKLVALAVGAFVAGAASFALAWLNQPLGYCLVMVGVAAAAVAFCLTIARMMDEDGWTQLKIFTLPYYDVYYLMCNFWVYFPMMCIRTIGVAIAVGAGIGLATHH